MFLLLKITITLRRKERCQLKQKVCCFSGYRPEKMPDDMWEGSAAFAEMQARLRQEILRAAELGYTAFLSGMSRGFDLWAAEEVLALNEQYGLELELWAAIAFHGMETYWEPEWQERYTDVLLRSRYTFSVCDTYRPGCYSERDSFLVERSSRVICFYDGVPGGTEYTVNLARRNGLDICNIADEQQVLAGF